MDLNEEPAKIGRPCRLTPTVRAKILEAVAAGATRENAAEAAGIGETTLHRWLRRGKREKGGHYWQFRQELDAVDSGFACDLAAIIRRNIEREEVTKKTTTLPDGTTKHEVTTRMIVDMDSAFRLLALRFPDHWGPRAAEAADLKTLLAWFKEIRDLADGIDDPAGNMKRNAAHWGEVAKRVEAKLAKERREALKVKEPPSEQVPGEFQNAKV